MKAFFDYYKWHIFFFILIIVCFVFIFSNMTSSVTPDLSIGYVGINYVNVQTFNDNKAEIELLMRDADGDGDRKAFLTALTLDMQSDLNEALAEYADIDQFDIYITTKDTFKNFKDKSFFISANEYAGSKLSELDTLKDSKKRVYAVSLEDNDFVKKMGILNTEDLYIAVAASELEKDEELPGNRKNARNIAGYILGEQ